MDSSIPEIGSSDQNLGFSSITTIPTSTSSSSSSSSRYENQKRRDWNTFGQYLKNYRPPLSLSRCSGAHVLEFLRYLDQFGKTKVHTPICLFYGHPNPPAPCPCPLRQAWGSLDALIGRLRAAFEENGGKPEANPFGARAVRLYLREVRDLQSKARGIERPPQQQQLQPGVNPFAKSLRLYLREVGDLQLPPQLQQLEQQQQQQQQQNQVLQLPPVADYFFRKVQVQYLEVLNLSNTNFEILPMCIVDLHNLRALFLSNCRRLRQVPSLAGLKTLVLLDLYYSENIKEVPEGLESVSKLKYLNLYRTGLKEFPIEILENLPGIQFLASGAEIDSSFGVEVEDLANLKLCVI